MSEPAETELKLALVKGSVAKVERILGPARLDRTSIDDVYFDTPDQALRRRCLVLRVRRDGERWIQTLKAGPSEQNLVPVRGEWEVPLAGGSKLPSLELERFDSAPMRMLMPAGLDAASLSPVFRSRITRQRTIVASPSSEVEIALDEGVLHVQVDGRRRRQRVAEVEVELKSGRAEALLDVAAGLLRHRRGVKLVPALRSKAERGYALASGGALEVVRAAARGFAGRVGPDTDRPGALRAVIRHGLAIVVANADALRQAPAPEHVHQARVALRRMRSAIRLLDPRGGDFPAALLRHLRWLARVLGRARDWDVVDEDTLPVIVAEAGLERATQRRLELGAARSRSRALARAVAAVSSRRYARLVLGAARWTMSSSSVAMDQEIPVAGLLDYAADLLFKDARTFARLDVHGRHRVRIHAKRLRYALDLLSSRLPERSAREYVEALAALQDTLGELNDASVAVERLVPFAATRRGERALQEWLGRAESEPLALASRQLRALARRARPWARRNQA